MFTIQTVTDLQWCDAEHTLFMCNVKYEEFDEIHPTGANPADNHAHIQELWANGNAGVYGPIAEYVPPPVVEIIAATPENQPTQQGAQNL